MIKTVLFFGYQMTDWKSLNAGHITEINNNTHNLLKTFVPRADAIRPYTKPRAAAKKERKTGDRKTKGETAGGDTPPLRVSGI
jgi:hypothetical protein